MLTMLLDWILGKIVKPNDPSESGRELYAVVRGGRFGNTMELFWLPLHPETSKERSDIYERIRDKYPGCHIRLASEEDPWLYIALKLREWRGYEWRKKD